VRWQRGWHGWVPTVFRHTSCIRPLRGLPIRSSVWPVIPVRQRNAGGCGG